MQTNLARASDPLTSHEAAARVPKFSTGQYKRIMDALAVCLQICSERGATAAEIGSEAGLTVVQVDRRLHELRKAGRIRVLVHDDGGDVMRDGFRCWGLV